MSFVKRAVKSVFKVVKKVVKKAVSFVKRVVKSDWFKIVAIIALSVFTAGLAAGGFAIGSAGGLTGFFQGVGATMANGWAAITSSVTGMFGAGAANAGSTAAGGSLLGAASGTAAEAGIGVGLGSAATGAGAAAATGAGTGILSAGAQSAFLAGGTANVVGGLTAGGLASTITPAVTQTATKGVLSKFGSLLMDPGLGGTMMRQGIMTGIQMYAQNEQYEQQEEYFRNRTVWGGPAFGGSAEPMQFLRPSEDQTAAGAAAAEMQMMTPQQEALLVQQESQQPMAPSQGAGMLGVVQEPTPNQRLAATQQPLPQQPPPAMQPQQNSPAGLLQLETVGAYV